MASYIIEPGERTANIHRNGESDEWTAEKVRELLKRQDEESSSRNEVRTESWWMNPRMYHAIADELNATLGGGECSIEERNGDWYCTGCGEMVGTCDTASELHIDGNAVELWNHCPRCGKAVKR